MKTPNPWSAKKAGDWYERQPWPCGFNYIPANAISYTEMWMDYCFDPTWIDGELKLAQDTGFNCARVVLPFVVWEHEPEAFKRRLEKFLEICHARGIRVMPALFDDCAFGSITDPVFGQQPDVVSGLYASGWTPSPGHGMVRNPSTWPRLEKYVKDIIGTFGEDPRLWVWDLYNEPTNGVCVGETKTPLGDLSIPLVEKTVQWAREINPIQPLTVGEWSDNAKLNNLIRSISDILTFHDYNKPEGLEKHIGDIKSLGRPAICTEWLNRCAGSSVADCLPIFRRENIGAMHWGLVNGRTQTHLNWGHLPGQPEPEIWQHDLFRRDHTAYDPVEIQMFKAAIRLNPQPY
ncbi:MAG: cellulase family glycosylhydrolase [Methylacidiphilales bacterium]|nr:cellulase family glycosylhydrolase [Candidatus Methylacidiphilales bacterium]